jgi:SAM-dependent methyltransferase
MTTPQRAEPIEINWSDHRRLLVAAAETDRDWYVSLAQHLVRPTDRLAVDVGCGGAGMTEALSARMTAGRVVAVDGDADVLAAARDRIGLLRSDNHNVHARIVFVHADLDAGTGAMAAALSEPVDLLWASASVHHLGDQQAAVNGLADLLASGGRLALAEGGLRPRTLPWDLGIGDAGLEVRLDAANDLWFARMRADLPGSVRMPYGWPEALRRAGLIEVTTRTTLVERPTPLSDDNRADVIARLAWQLHRLADLLDADDVAAWRRLLDADDEMWLGRRNDLFCLEARSVHIGHKP